MNHCCHISDQSDNFRKCYDKTKFGNYCHKHRSKYLLDENQSIIRERFTGKSKDYFVKDIRRYCKEHKLLDTKGLSGKKNDVFQAVIDVIATMNFTGGNIVSDIVYNGGYQAVVVDGSGRPDGPPVGVQATGQTFYCCID